MEPLKSELSLCKTVLIDARVDVKVKKPKDCWLVTCKFSYKEKIMYNEFGFCYCEYFDFWYQLYLFVAFRLLIKTVFQYFEYFDLYNHSQASSTTYIETGCQNWFFIIIVSSSFDFLQKLPFSTLDIYFWSS